MNKMNKKGFTLIEMLVVIAIIAVLVSIVVPTVTSATGKAAAATNAANLRTVAAQVAIWKTEDNSLTTDALTIENGKISATVNEVARSCEAPAPKAVSELKVTKDSPLAITIGADNITATFGGVSINTFADFAEDGKVG